MKFLLIHLAIPLFPRYRTFSFLLLLLLLPLPPKPEQKIKAIQTTLCIREFDQFLAILAIYRDFPSC